MLSLKAQSRKTEKMTQSAQASDSRALTSPGGNGILPGVLSSVSVQWQFSVTLLLQKRVSVCNPERLQWGTKLRRIFNDSLNL